jgi:hypothetical protein
LLYENYIFITTCTNMLSSFVWFYFVEPDLGQTQKGGSVKLINVTPTISQCHYQSLTITYILIPIICIQTNK